MSTSLHRNHHGEAPRTLDIAFGLPAFAADPPPADLRHGSGQGGAPITIGLVNNMADGALKRTERQFRRLLAGGIDGTNVQLRLFALAEIPRSEQAREYLAGTYAGMDQLMCSRLDALVITGAEPKTARIEDEVYWRSLIGLFEWAAANTISTFASCLAAQAAALHFDGIERRRLPTKCCGVFEHAKAAQHPLMRGKPARWPVAHSRWHELPEARLTDAGYAILSRSEHAGVNLFAKERNSLFVFAQGHPEYEPDTLLKEYQRDVSRYLSGERANYPSIPEGCLNAASEAELASFRNLAEAHRSPDLMAAFPTLTPDHDHVDCSGGTARLFRNWLRFIIRTQQHRTACLAAT